MANHVSDTVAGVANQTGKLARSPTIKLIIICGLILALLIPLALVRGLISEREGRAEEVRRDVSKTWGGKQFISGPYLILPYTVQVRVREGGAWIVRTEERRAVFLPEELNISGNAESKILKRSIFDVNVYTSKLSLEGKFRTPTISEIDPNAQTVRWKDATFAISMSNVSGLKEAAKLTINGQDDLAFAPSLGIPGRQPLGIHAKLRPAVSLGLQNQTLAPFSFKLSLLFTGSKSLMFAPAARETRVQLTADWPHPSFSGEFLPTDRKISSNGFEATWRVPHLARSVPNAWSLSTNKLDRFGNYGFGVRFYQPVDFYDTVTRAVKYAVLFLGLAYMTVFVIELVSARPVHAVQYFFVGLSMVFFYVLLLSLSEHIGFKNSYIIAAGATGTMLAVYVGKALRSLLLGLAMIALFALVYGFLYLILQLEDYALLAGAILGFAALTAVMFATLRVDWSGKSLTSNQRTTNS